MPVLRQETIETFISNNFKSFKENFIKWNQVKRSLQRALFYRDITTFGRGLLIRPILWRSPILFTLPFFKFCPSPSPTSTPLLFLLPCFFGWMGDHATFAVLDYSIISRIYMLSFGTIVPERPCWVFYALRCQGGLTHSGFFLVPLFYITYTYKDTQGANRLTHPYKQILALAVMCS